MSAVQDYQRLYHQLANELPGHAIDGIRQMREAAIGRFAELGFPTRKQEAWKYTRLQALEQATFAPQIDAAAAIQAEQLPLAGLDAHRLVFVDGHFHAGLSQLQGLPSGVLISELSGLLQHSASATPLQALFDAEQHGTDVLRALNQAFVTDGATITILAGTEVERPIHLVYVSSAERPQAASYGYNLVVMERDSRARLIESHVALGQAQYVNSLQTDIHLAAGAQLQHYKLQLEGEAGLHLAATRIDQGPKSQYQNHLFALGAQLMRNELGIQLNGEAASCVANGLFLAQGEQHLDMQTQTDHRAPGCSSRELYRGMADDRSRGIFNGMVKVHRDAQQSDAQLTSNNLLLSRQAEIDAKPQLEIDADDVKCAHGATIGQLDPDVLFYLRSRGIDADTARDLMLYAFANAVVEACPYGEVSGIVRQRLLQRLRGGAQLQELLT